MEHCGTTISSSAALYRLVFVSFRTPRRTTRPKGPRAELARRPQALRDSPVVMQNSGNVSEHHAPIPCRNRFWPRRQLRGTGTRRKVSQLLWSDSKPETSRIPLVASKLHSHGVGHHTMQKLCGTLRDFRSLKVWA